MYTVVIVVVMTVYVVVVIVSSGFLEDYHNLWRGCRRTTRSSGGGCPLPPMRAAKNANLPRVKGVGTALTLSSGGLHRRGPADVLDTSTVDPMPPLIRADDNGRVEDPTRAISRG